MSRHDEQLWRRGAALSAGLPKAIRWLRACTADACKQGRIRCATPDACRLSEPRRKAPQPSRNWFADCPRANRAVCIALSFAVGALFWLFGTGQ